MQTIIVLLNPGELENPDMDLSYLIPKRIEEISDQKIRDNGYDFLDTEAGQPGPLMGIWLETASADDSWPLILKLFQTEKFKGNDLSKSARLYISEHDTEELEQCTMVFPKREE